MWEGQLTAMPEIDSIARGCTRGGEGNLKYLGRRKDGLPQACMMAGRTMGSYGGLRTEKQLTYHII